MTPLVLPREKVCGLCLLDAPKGDSSGWEEQWSPGETWGRERSPTSTLSSGNKDIFAHFGASQQSGLADESMGSDRSDGGHECCCWVLRHVYDSLLSLGFHSKKGSLSSLFSPPTHAHFFTYLPNVIFSGNVWDLLWQRTLWFSAYACFYNETSGEISGTKIIQGESIFSQGKGGTPTGCPKGHVESPVNRFIHGESTFSQGERGFQQGAQKSWAVSGNAVWH